MVLESRDENKYVAPVKRALDMILDQSVPIYSPLGLTRPTYAAHKIV